MKTQIVPTQYFDVYHEKQRIAIGKHIIRLKRTPLDRGATVNATIEAAFFSSKIDGNPILLDNYKTYHFTGNLPLNRPAIPEIELVFLEAAVASCNIEGNLITMDEYLTLYYQRINSIEKADEIKDIYNAYEFAQTNELTLFNFYQAHEILSRSLIGNPKYRGVNRDREAGVYLDGELLYKPATVSEIEGEMGKLFIDIDLLMNRGLSMLESFYFASFIHQILTYVHPFSHGNGIAARLLEKWFLAQTIGSVAWMVPSEKLYQTRTRKYNENINLGPDYPHIDYGLSLPFLLLLPKALTAKYKTDGGKNQ